MKNILSPASKCLTAHILSSLLFIAPSMAEPTACAPGEQGKYVTWIKNTFRTGKGKIIEPAGYTSSFPNFEWNVRGEPNEVEIESGEPFGGGNSMVDIYGSAASATNLKVRIEGNYRSPGHQIAHSATIVINFDTPTPSSGWGFAFVDLDVDQVKFTARNATGQKVSATTMKNWFVERFDADPVADGINLPKWDPTNIAVIGSSSSSSTWRTKVEGGLEDTEAGSAWFQPDVSLSQIIIEFQSLQVDAYPSYHILMAACAQTLTPAPTPTPAADDDGDGINNSDEGTEDTDEDGVPDYEDLDSDDDTILDQVEGSDDEDGDGTPDFEDLDSDGDDVLDIIERDPDSEPTTPTGDDTDDDGIDDGNEDRTDDPLSDTDGDTIPDSIDEDSDNDGLDDGEEAYDLDGDGDRDIEESGDDNNENGVDDTFEEFNDPDELNPEYIDEPALEPCDTLATASKKSRAVKRLNALANRVPTFAAKAAACGDSSLSNLVNNSNAIKALLEQSITETYADEELLCPVGTCSRVNRQDQKDLMRELANELYSDAKRAKMAAIAACNISDEPNKNDPRPQTIDYLNNLNSAIRRLPRRVSRCD